MSQITSAERREKIVEILLNSEKPMSASTLAKKFQVSRQIIVGDVALLRASGSNVFATPKGYICQSDQSSHSPFGFMGMVPCKHTEAQLVSELYTIVDFGGCVIDVTIEHAIYGQLSGSLDIHSRRDVDEFVNKVVTGQGRPLSDLTGGIHLHRIGCKDKETFDLISQELKRLGILLT
ncbi:MAG: transcription repressor NadR [Anaerovorax sp.]